MLADIRQLPFAFAVCLVLHRLGTPYPVIFTLFRLHELVIMFSNVITRITRDIIGLMHVAANSRSLATGTILGGDTIDPYVLKVRVHPPRQQIGILEEKNGSQRCA